MCQMFAGQPRADYESHTRSLRLNGHSTSIRLENTFWTILEEIAAREGLSVAKFVGTLHDEVVALHGEVQNLASLLRCSCLLYVRNQAGLGAGPTAIAAE